MTSRRSAICLDADEGCNNPVMAAPSVTKNEEIPIEVVDGRKPSSVIITEESTAEVEEKHAAPSLNYESLNLHTPVPAKKSSDLIYLLVFYVLSLIGLLVLSGLFLYFLQQQYGLTHWATLTTGAVVSLVVILAVGFIVIYAITL